MKISHSCRQDRPDGHIGVLHKRLVVVLTIFSASALAVLLAWCNSFEDPEQSSTDIDALKRLINLQFPYTSARWELVPTPELSGAVPGPTDYITLIAEIGPRDDQEFSSLPIAEPFHPLTNTAQLDECRIPQPAQYIECRVYRTSPTHRLQKCHRHPDAFVAYSYRTFVPQRRSNALVYGCRGPYDLHSLMPAQRHIDNQRGRSRISVPRMYFLKRERSVPHSAVNIHTTTTNTTTFHIYNNRCN